MRLVPPHRQLRRREAPPWRSRALPWAAGLAAPLAALLLAAGCAKTEDVSRLEQVNRVQDQRLRALEESAGTQLRKIGADLLDLRRILDGRTANLEEQLKQLAAEQAKLLEASELTQAQQKRLERHLEEQTKAIAQYRADADSEMDKLRLRMKDVEGLMRSPIAQLPATTEGDKAFREATFLLINGQMDLAADRFGRFAQRFGKDPRRPEALLRQGQAYFLLRQYDHALVPLFEVVEKNAQHKAAGEARWLLARSLEETGDLKLARDFYAQLVSSKSAYSADASRRVALMNRLLPGGAGKPAPPPAAEDKPAKPEPAAKPPAGGPDEADDETGDAAGNEPGNEPGNEQPAVKRAPPAAKGGKAAAATAEPPAKAAKAVKAPAKAAKAPQGAAKSGKAEKAEPPTKAPQGAAKGGKAGKAAKRDSGAAE